MISLTATTDQLSTATTAQQQQLSANEPTNYFGQSVKKLKQVWQTRQNGAPLSAIQTWQGAPARTETTKG
jgi:hypothetical protein